MTATFSPCGEVGPAFVKPPLPSKVSQMNNPSNIHDLNLKVSADQRKTYSADDVNKVRQQGSDLGVGLEVQQSHLRGADTG